MLDKTVNLLRGLYTVQLWLLPVRILSELKK